MSMEGMLKRLRSMSGKQLKSPTVPSQHLPGQRQTTPSTTPSKDDILSTLDGFGEKIQEPIPSEDNNNKHVRRYSAASVNSETENDSMDTGVCDTEPTITSITHSYSLEWEKLFLKTGYLRHLRNYALKGNLRSSRFRSISWKLFLGVLEEDTTAWINKTKQSRAKYKDLKDKLIVNPRKAVDTQDLSFNNPLSQEDESPWNRFFLDNELRLTIKQDVIRTFPEIEFYRSEKIRELMTDILLCYCRLHDTLSYRQGMHELLAPIIFVLHCDHQAFLHASEMESLDILDIDSSEKIKVVLDPKYLEHDAYAMFSQVMLTMEPWYVSKEVYPTKSADVNQPFARPQDMNPSNVIVTKLTRIQDYLLKKADHELHFHLEKHEIAPQIYGIRWIRLLFGREFPMQDLLVLWDAIFADGIGFDLVDYIFVAMLLYLRDHLLSSDYPSCLNTLMRYPPVGDIHFFIDKARHLRDPHQFPRPPLYTYQSVQTAEKIVKQQEIKESPTPGNVPQHKRGSSASLSQVEESMFRSTQSSSTSLARYETQSLRSNVTTPDDQVSVNDSPTRYSSMSSRGKNKKKKTTAVDSASEAEIAALRGSLHDKESMCSYCATKLDLHIDRLQAQLLQQDLSNEDEILVAIAGIKQVRDVLKGTLRFSQNLLDEDEISMNFNHYKMDVSSSESPDTDSSPGFSEAEITKDKIVEKHLFYVSSEENSEAIDSPSDPSLTSGANNPNINFKLPALRDFELDDFKSGRKSRHFRNKDYISQNRSSGPNNCESEFSKSWNGESSRDTSPESEESPNPLYRIRHNTYDL
ncbi:TBC1 domain [Mactra antiquata]